MDYWHKESHIPGTMMGISLGERWEEDGACVGRIPESRIGCSKKRGQFRNRAALQPSSGRQEE